MPPAALAAGGPPAALCLHSDVAVVEARDGGVRLLDLRGGFFALDDMAAGLVRALLEGGVDHAIRHLGILHDIDQAEAAREVRAFVRLLAKTGVLAQHRRVARSLRTSAARALAGLACQAADPEIFGRRLLPVLKLVLAVTDWESAVEFCAVVQRRRGPPGRPADACSVDLDTLELTVRRIAGGSALGAECKERALLFWTSAGRLGAPVDLVVGVRLYPLEGHCWCEAEGRRLSDDSTRCLTYRPIRRYRMGKSGELVRETACAWAST